MPKERTALKLMMQEILNSWTAEEVYEVLQEVRLEKALENKNI